MTATTAARPTPSSTSVTVHRVSFGRVLRSEWVKFRTLRSTVWTVVLTVIVMIGLALMMASIMQTAAQNPEMAEGMAQDPRFASTTGTTVITFGYSFAQLAVAVLGALAVTNEYGTGMIRSTFAAVPRRLPALWAKLVVIVVATVVVTLVALALSYLATLPMLGDANLTVDLSDSEQVRSLLGCALYLATVAALAVAVGTLMRHSAGAIFTLVAVFFVLPIVFQLVSSSSDAAWAEWTYKLLPSVAGERVIASGVTPDTLLEPWTGYAVLAGYTVVAIVAAAVTLRRRDA